MKKFKLYIIILPAVMSFALPVQSQDFHFTQFFANKLFLAPSFAGATAQNRLIANYRNQWPGLPKGFATYSVSVDHFISNYNSGLGVIAMRDLAGSTRFGYLHLGMAYSYDFVIFNNKHIRPGVGFNYIQTTIDFSKATLSSMYNPQSKDYTGGSGVNFPEKNNIGAFDASFSTIFYMTNFTCGIGFDHLLQPNLTLLSDENPLPMKFSAFTVVTLLRRGRLLKPIDETVSVALLFKNQKKFNQLDLGVYWAQSPLTFGIWYRGIPILNSDRGDSFAALVGYKAQNFAFGYSYDFTVSNLINKTSGAHEISLAIEYAKQKKRKRHMVPCPEF
jgi:type IX secretion system PorP/SprF family membrane protein